MKLRCRFIFFVIAPLQEISGLRSHRTGLSLIFLGLSLIIGANTTRKLFYLHPIFHATLFLPLPSGSSGWAETLWLRFIPHDILQKNAISHATEFFFLSSIPAWYPFPSSNTSIRWRPAPLPYDTINIARSSKENHPGLYGAGGVARSATGEWLWGFSLNLGFANNTMAELWGMREALL